MSPPPSLVDNSTLMGSVHESDQEIHLNGVVTHTRSRALRAPWWAIVCLVQLGGLTDALELLLGAFTR
jgi:hypothetical protein